MSRHGEMQNPATVVSQDQEYIQHLKANGRHREEVDRYHALHMVLEKSSPGLGWRFSFAHQVFADTGFADVDDELEQFAVDARRSPKRVFAAHPANQLACFGRYAGTTATAIKGFPLPVEAESLRCQPMTVSGL